MARVQNSRRKSEGTSVRAYLVRGLIVALCLLTLVVGGFIIYFNGDNARAPLLKILAGRSGLEISASRMEFSPLYPDVIKLDDVRVGKSHIDQLYIEYEIKPLIAENRLKIRDLYIRGVKFAAADFERLMNDRLGFASVTVAKARLEETGLDMRRIKSPALALTLSNLAVGADGKLTVTEGNLSAAEIEADGFQLRNLNTAFSFTPQGLVLRNLLCEGLGGSIAAGEVFVTDGSALRLNGLFARNLVLHNPLGILGSRRLEVSKGELENVVAVFDEQDLMLGQISGRMLGLKAGTQGGSVVFEGKIGEISMPGSEITLENNDVEYVFSGNRASLKSKGGYAEGSYALEMEFNHQDRELRVRHLELKRCRLEPTQAQLGHLTDALNGWSVNVGEATFEENRLLSHIPGWPVSVKEFSGGAENLLLELGDQVPRLKQGSFNGVFQGLFYSDLGFARVRLKGDLTDGTFSLDLPEVVLQRSKFTAGLSYNVHGLGARLTAAADDFNLSELNCNLNPRFMSGYVNFNVNLTARDTLPALWRELNGEIKIGGEDLIVSALGLDLLNGGGMRQWKLSLGDLLEGLKKTDCGIGRLDFRANMSAPRARIESSMELTSGMLDLQADIDYEKDTVSGVAELSSLPGDSTTKVTLGGSLEEPEFEIVPLSRGEYRPGIFDAGGDGTDPGESAEPPQGFDVELNPAAGGEPPREIREVIDFLKEKQGEED